MMLRRLLAVLAVTLACAGCGPADKDYAPAPPPENVEAPPAPGMEENPGEPQP